jgi:D-gamma-glutamyl-meso-diaminopimelic acid endopeptidase CwlS
MENRKYWFLKVVESFLNMPYRWGGDDPTGFDCSGMVVEGLRACGLMGLNEDLSALGLWHKFKGRETPLPERGALVFWFHDNGKAKHVAVCLDTEVCLTADGGGRHIQTLADAIKHNAFIKILPIDHRKDRPKFVMPFK